MHLIAHGELADCTWRPSSTIKLQRTQMVTQKYLIPAHGQPLDSCTWSNPTNTDKQPIMLARQLSLYAQQG
jgi:hypothetical protein